MLIKIMSFLDCYLYLLTANAQIYIDPAVAAATGVPAGVEYADEWPDDESPEVDEYEQ